MGIADEMKRLGEDIVVSHDLRVEAIGGLVKDTHKMLKEFQAEHKEMAANLRASLEKGETERLRDFKSMMDGVEKFVAAMVEGTAKLMQEIRKEQGDRNKGVADLLEKFAKDHKDMADELKKSLAKGETDRLEGFKSMMAGIQKYVADVVKETEKLIKEIQARQDERNREVLDLLQEFKTEREKMAANWQTMATIMAKKRGAEPEVELKIKVKPVKEVVEEKKPLAEEVAEEIVEEEKPLAEEVVEEEKPLDERVLELIETHPEGIKVSDMEEPLGVYRTKLGEVAKRLLEEGRVRKEENLYLPL